MHRDLDIADGGNFYLVIVAIVAIVTGLGIIAGLISIFIPKRGKNIRQYAEAAVGITFSLALCSGFGYFIFKNYKLEVIGIVLIIVCIAGIYTIIRAIINWFKNSF